MPITIHPRPVRELCKRVRNSMIVFYAEIAAKGIVGVVFFLSLGIVPN